MIPLSILAIPGSKPVVLCQDRDVVPALEGKEELAAHLAENGSAEQNGIQMFLRSSSNYQPDRVLYDCLALRAPRTLPRFWNSIVARIPKRYWTD